MSVEQTFLDTIGYFNDGKDPWKLIDYRKIPRGIIVMDRRICNYFIKHNKLPHSITELKKWEKEYFKWCHLHGVHAGNVVTHRDHGNYVATQNTIPKFGYVKNVQEI